MAKHQITIQQASTATGIPSDHLLKRWVNAALAKSKKGLALTIRIVDKSESAELNQYYRHKQGPTNVLSFPFELPDAAYLGDIIICAPLVDEEATTQHKQIEQHWAHLVVHGTLHLLGYDHVKPADAVIMEALETTILTQLSYPDPYQDYE